ncbi:MAG: glycine--tRNA ligase subunit beta, partial [Deltaproteobacteria bacterium]|nr:glycine--tRNA ligase subunit beta [Deltaproteobacteria bacterium]
GKTLDPSLFKDPYEAGLFAAGEDIARFIEDYRQNGEYESVFKALISIKTSIDSFFDKVLVMTDDEAVRTNRLLLLSKIRGLYFETADLSRLMNE